MIPHSWYVGVWVNSHISAHSLSIAIEGTLHTAMSLSIPRNTHNEYH